jgi:hypothetical protein
MSAISLQASFLHPSDPDFICAPSCRCVCVPIPAAISNPACHCPPNGLHLGRIGCMRSSTTASASWRGAMPTACGSDRVQPRLLSSGGARAGCDDYVPKPFSLYGDDRKHARFFQRRILRGLEARYYRVISTDQGGGKRRCRHYRLTALFCQSSSASRFAAGRKSTELLVDCRADKISRSRADKISRSAASQCCSASPLR